MSDGKEIICPNCGFHATNNYCAQCGQETHLHRDTFGALFMHFIGHYFHYDSKFWQTLKALWFRPGKLTHAYWNKQRARYISPVSLYIFISAVFFTCAFLILPNDSEHKTTEQYEQEVLAYKNDSTAYKIAKALSPELAAKVRKKTDYKEILESKKRTDTILEKLGHNIPKLFFLLLPVMAVTLKGMYYKRKELTVVHHSIFALHAQSVFFTIFFFVILLGLVDNWFVDAIANILLLLPIAYMVVSMRNTYGSGWVRSILYSIILVLSCFVVSFILLLSFYIIARKYTA